MGYDEDTHYGEYILYLYSVQALTMMQLSSHLKSSEMVATVALAIISMLVTSL